MLEIFMTKRKCKVNASFFPFLVKKLPSIRQQVIAVGMELQNREGIRPAQKRVMEKMLKSMVKNKQVKQEEIDE